MSKKGLPTTDNDLSADSFPYHSSLPAHFQYVNGPLGLSEENQVLFQDAALWFKEKIASGIDPALDQMRKDHFPTHWFHEIWHTRMKKLYHTIPEGLEDKFKNEFALRVRNTTTLFQENMERLKANNLANKVAADGCGRQGNHGQEYRQE
ncbi:hypothetical protein BGZ65_002950 [Modicella reniformis]|uniref:Uncharacterized protein n=1 Tax=Modicella reniformis TaxID=1440133 RepID=A0A9P6J0I6_9FUNG|nr:hypothetical protein BGZ65_002950 [Modicella reniformis]